MDPTTGILKNLDGATTQAELDTIEGGRVFDAANHLGILFCSRAITSGD
ncbi:MAG: hypothetical protein ACK5LO_05095 [Leucobacter sp.]